MFHCFFYLYAYVSFFLDLTCIIDIYTFFFDVYLTGEVLNNNFTINNYKFVINHHSFINWNIFCRVEMSERDGMMEIRKFDSYKLQKQVLNLDFLF